MNCPKCNHTIDPVAIRREANRLAGFGRSAAKAAAARENGKKGGRPRKDRPQ